MLINKARLTTSYTNRLLNNEYVRSIRQEFEQTDPGKIRNENLLYQIEVAKSHGNLAVGIAEIHNAINMKKGKLLVGERDYLFPAVNKCQRKYVALNLKNSKAISLTEAVDSAMETVMDQGGDIEFVENGMLKKYKHLVMIQHD